MSRLRTNPEAKQKIYESELMIKPDMSNIAFKNTHPTFLEVGMGKGSFIINHALQYHDHNFYGLEKYETVILKAINKTKNSPEVKNNLKFIAADANKLLEIFKPNSLDGIYLNFSDPWPKKRHAKKRLTNPAFLELYYQLLKDKGQLIFKTDNLGFFEYSLEAIKEFKKFTLVYYTYDLYQDINLEVNKKNIPTEYEIKFHNLGTKINKLILTKTNS